MATDDRKPDEPVEEPKEPAVAYEFTPRVEGEFLMGVPATDLTKAQFADLDPALQLAATAPGPDGKALYTKATHRKK